MCVGGGGVAGKLVSVCGGWGGVAGEGCVCVCVLSEGGGH